LIGSALLGRFFSPRRFFFGRGVGAKKTLSILFFLSVASFGLWWGVRYVRMHTDTVSLFAWFFNEWESASQSLSFKNFHFPVTSVNITGPFVHISQKEVESELAALVETGFFKVELKKIRQSLDSFSWIDSVTIERQWPGTINIYLKERVAVAVWRDNLLVTSAGFIFNPGKRWKNEESLPYLSGENDQSLYVLEMYGKISTILSRVDLQLLSLELTSLGSWVMKVDKGFELYVDKKETLEKLKRWSDIYTQFSELGVKVARVDLRYENGVAIKWLGEKQ
jgi:cell division protein FtsQ